jgi:AmiR/NasT family two-component response regulator
MEKLNSHRHIAKTPSLLKDLRSLVVAVVHPDDSDRLKLIQQLQRIGCQVKAFWPTPSNLPQGIDIIFLAVQPDSIDMEYEWLTIDAPPPLIAVVAYENPTIVQTVLEIGAHSILPSPIRSFGVLLSLVVARRVHGDLQSQRQRTQKLETKFLGVRQIAEAKNILMISRNLNEKDAYELIRDRAMSKRITTEEVAISIINANEILSLGQTDSHIQSINVKKD